MGTAKDRLIDQEDQGWRFVDGKSVCENCFDDDALKAVVRSNAAEEVCDYCGKKAAKAIAAPMNEVMAVIADGIHSEWTDPIHVLPYESREGGYQGDTYDTRGMLSAIEFPSENGKLVDDVARSLMSSIWCRRRPFSLSRGDALKVGWDEFCRKVKYETRYVFLAEKEEGRTYEGEDEVPVGEVLDAIGPPVSKVRALRKLMRGARFIRARPHKAEDAPASAADLGPPPANKARYANRMSPAGIPMFYAASDEATAIAETPADQNGVKSMLTLATFETLKDMRVVDLARLPGVPSLFDDARRHLRDEAMFLYDFVRDLSKPIEKDGLEHIEYVPTQIVTEYFRRVFKTKTGQHVNGILYPSSRRRRGRCVVLFAEQEDCCDTVPSVGSDSDALLRLLPETIKRLSMDEARLVLEMERRFDFEHM